MPTLCTEMLVYITMCQNMVTYLSDMFTQATITCFNFFLSSRPLDCVRSIAGFGYIFSFLGVCMFVCHKFCQFSVKYKLLCLPHPPTLHVDDFSYLNEILEIQCFNAFLLIWVKHGKLGE